MKKLLSGLALFSLCVTAFFAEGFGLVLSGGGAKGAYEVGVWKALEDYGISDKITVISGTSVGALNAALFACTDSGEAETLWREEVGYSSFLMPDTSTFSEVAAFAVRSAKNNLGERNMQDNPYNLSPRLSPVESELLRQLLDGVTFIADTGLGLAKGTVHSLTEYIFSEAHSDGIFERDALKAIMEKNISLDKLEKSGIDVYATAIPKDGFLVINTLGWLFGSDSVHYFKLNEQLNSTNVNDILLASSAFPLVYESTRLSANIIENGKVVGRSYEYIDGGFESVGGKNVPVLPAAKSDKVDKIIVVYLKSAEEISNSYTSRRVDEYEANGKELIEILPSKSLGDFVDGTINFDPENINQLIDLGYSDACAVLEEKGYSKSSKLKRFLKNVF